MTKNSFGLLLGLLALLGLLFTGCQAPNLPQGTPVSQPSSTQGFTSTPGVLATSTVTPTPTLVVTPINVDSASLKGKEVVLWHPWDGELRKTLEDLINKFNSTNQWGISARAVQMGDSQTLYAYLETIISKPSDVSIPNLILAAPDQISSLNDQAGLAVNLASYLADSTYGLTKAEQKAIPDIFWNQEHGTVGKTTGLPALRTLYVIFYNLSWAKELGYAKPPTLPEEFRKQACAAAYAVTNSGNKDNAGTGGWLTNNEPETMISWMEAFGDLDLPTRSSQTYHFNTPANQKMVDYLSGLFNDDCAWISRMPNPNQYDYFAKRQALMISGDLTDVDLQAKAFKRSGNADEWAMIPYPNSADKTLVFAGGYSYAVLRHDDQTDLAAWLLARWLNQSENLALLSQSSGMIPANKDALTHLEDYENAHPQWKDALGWMDNIQPLPGVGTWQTARQVVGDAGWQLFHPKPTPDSPINLLNLLDRTVTDAILHRP